MSFIEPRGSLAVPHFLATQGRRSRFVCCRLCLQLQPRTGKRLSVTVVLFFHVV